MPTLRTISSVEGRREGRERGEGEMEEVGGEERREGKREEGGKEAKRSNGSVSS